MRVFIMGIACLLIILIEFNVKYSLKNSFMPIIDRVLCHNPGYVGWNQLYACQKEIKFALFSDYLKLFLLQVCTSDDSCRYARVSELFVYEKFSRIPVEIVEAGDICAVCGISDIQVIYSFPP